MQAGKLRHRIMNKSKRTVCMQISIICAAICAVTGLVSLTMWILGIPSILNPFAALLVLIASSFFVMGYDSFREFDFERTIRLSNSGRLSSSISDVSKTSTFERDLKTVGRIRTARTDHAKKLILDYGDVCFACGEHDGDTKEYAALSAARESAFDVLLAAYRLGK